MFRTNEHFMMNPFIKIFKKLISLALTVILISLSLGQQMVQAETPIDSNHGNQNSPVPDLNIPILYPTIEFDPIISLGMILKFALVDRNSNQIVGNPVFVKVRSENIVSIPGLGPVPIAGRKLSQAIREINQLTGQVFQIGVVMSPMNTVQVLGKVQKPGNYPADLPLSALIAEAMDRAQGSNFKVSYFDGAERTLKTLRYEDIVKGKENPLVPQGSIIYFPPSAGSLFGELTEKQINLIYLIVITISALGFTAITRQ